MSFHYRHRKIIIICILFFTFCISTFFFYYKNSYKKKNRSRIVQSKKIVKDNNKISVKKENSHNKNIFKVDIKGQIVFPGIYELEEDSRVIDVINKAGGLTEDADTTVINLSKKIKDEMVIIVYSKEEVNDFKKTKEIEKETLSKCAQKDNDSVINDACIDNSEKGSVQDNSLLININTASLDDLKTLSGIGEAKAKSIIDYRNSNGLFNSIEDLKNVDGIGESLYDQIKNSITI